MEKLKILFVASEVSPYIKSGGLGEVASSLPKALAKMDVDIRVVFPKYRTMATEYVENLSYIDSIQIRLSDWNKPYASILELKKTNIKTYLIENEHFFGRGHLYGFWDDYERFAFFARAAIDMLPIVNFKPDIIHFNDWQTALGCIYLKDTYNKFAYYSNIKSLFTIHNLQYQGHFDPDVLPHIDLNYGYFTNDKLEYYNRVNFMKAGLAYSDYISTVSPTYADEIQTPAYGYGLEGLIKSRSSNLVGILNGIDYDINNPKTNKIIPANYSADSIDGKAICKSKMQEKFYLPVKDVPVFAIISRFAEQKGMDLIGQALYQLLHKDIQIIVLGTGDEHFEHMFRSYAHQFPQKLSANVGFNDTLAHEIYAGSDFFLMPSRFEPCGLGQITAMRYGSLPIGRHTGGLYDTIKHYNYETKEGNGFLFRDYIYSGLIWAVDEAIHLYNSKEHFEAARLNALKSDYSWEKSAKDYISLYKKIIAKN